MKLHNQTVIAREKITKYLLQYRLVNDKSKFLNYAGYKIENWQQLENDIREQILPLEAVFIEKTRYGDIFEIRENLIGPNGKTLKVVTIWMSEHNTKITKFITLFPDKEH